ncbi:hypothetical protein FOMG_17422 [Fusarium oxysporum f. sp. melonis 26406]|uniref:Uncharacterized protein n=1 Tax=Fusarium oxysporum f. sp. melonis 26406 TaxID=1089452 RepID=W9ZY44_FUSOX|nr:hypothetical protein FOMG_17422 [Fusarium oxysporum f. sp. melonis 26406]
MQDEVAVGIIGIGQAFNGPTNETGNGVSQQQQLTPGIFYSTISPTVSVDLGPRIEGVSPDFIIPPTSLEGLSQKTAPIVSDVCQLSVLKEKIHPCYDKGPAFDADIR